MAYLVDTDILIDLAKGNQGAISYLDSLGEPWSVSIMTAMEVIVGAMDKREMAKIDEFLAAFHVIQFGRETGEKAYGLLKTFSKSHGLRIFDAIVAATAIVADRILVTRNQKHFRMIPELRLEVPKY